MLLPKTPSYYELKASLAVCRFTGTQCSDEQFEIIQQRLVHEFQAESEAAAARQQAASNSAASQPACIEVDDSDDDAGNAVGGDSRHSSSSNLCRALTPHSPNSKQNRQKRLRTFYQVCKPLPQVELEHVAQNAKLASSALQLRDEFIHLLKDELAVATRAH